MGWSALGTQFCLELGFGVLLALAFVPRAPVGTLFYRIMGTCAFLPVLVAAAASLGWGGATAKDPAVLAAGLAVLAYPFVSGPLKGWRWAAALGWALLFTAIALVATVARAATLEGAGEVFLGSLTAMATGAVAGSVSLAMVLGHWYLTIPTLDVGHLRRLNRVTAVSIVVCLALLGYTCAAFASRLGGAERPLFGAWGLFYLGTRLAVGLVLPLVFAWMTAGSLQFRNTRSATGILYASTILVLIGTAVSVSLQGSYGIPL
jgi:hypothetical protein